MTEFVFKFIKCKKWETEKILILSSLKYKSLVEGFGAKFQKFLTFAQNFLTTKKLRILWGRLFCEAGFP